MKIVSIVGARPQFIKAATIAKEIKLFNHKLKSKKIKEILVHTGQHYDWNMSDLFFKELSLKSPDYNLMAGSGSHAEQTSRMMIGIKKVLLKEKPSLVLVYGDTNSTLSGALVASRLNIPVVHIESGMRSFNRMMPEEINRILTDRLSSILFCSSKTAREILLKEGIGEKIYIVGDVMLDSLKDYLKIARCKSRILTLLGIEKNAYYLLTVHRVQNTENKRKLLKLLRILDDLRLPVVFPLHPRTRKLLSLRHSHLFKNIKFIRPVSYTDMLMLEDNAKLIFTDSGGVQKEAFFLKVPCLTLRDETEWKETVLSGWNKLVGDDRGKIIKSAAFYNKRPNLKKSKNFYGRGNASRKIIRTLFKYYNNKRNNYA